MGQVSEPALTATQNFSDFENRAPTSPSMSAEVRPNENKRSSGHTSSIGAGLSGFPGLNEKSSTRNSGINMMGSELVSHGSAVGEGDVSFSELKNRNKNKLH